MLGPHFVFEFIYAALLLMALKPVAQSNAEVHVCQRAASTAGSDDSRCAAGEIRVDPTLTKVDDKAFAFFHEGGGIDRKGNLTAVDFVECDRLIVIGDHSFYNNKITQLNLPFPVEYIGYGAFAWNDIAAVSLPSSVRTIGWYAFAGNQLKMVTIPSSVYTIGYAAFEYNMLSAIRIPYSVKTIRENAFFGNPLTSACYEGKRPSPEHLDASFFGIKIPFEKCLDSAYTSSNEVMGSISNTNLNAATATATTTPPEICKKSRARGGKKGCIGSIIIDPSSTVIDKEAFENADITAVDFSRCKQLNNIGHRAFANNKISSLTIPPTVSFIGYDAFVNNQITSIRIPASVSNIKEGAFFGNPLTSACWEGKRPSPGKDASFFGISIPFEKCPHIQTKSEL